MGGTSVVQRGRRWAVVAYAGIDPATKRQRQKWFGGFATHREAEQFRLTLAHSPTFSAGQGPYGSPRLRTGDYLSTWHDERVSLGALRDRTAKGTEMMIRRYLSPYIGHIPLTRLGPPAIQQLYVTLLERGLSPATVVRAVGVLHVALEQAVRRGLIARNPQANTTLPAVPHYEPTIMTPEQLRAYLADASETTTPAIYALYVTAAGGGARPGELLGIPDEAVDLLSGRLHIHQTLVRAGRNPVFGPNKTRSGRRTILLPDEAVEAIRAALHWKKEQRLKLGPRYRDAGLIFCGPSGRPINPSNLRNRDHLPRLVRLRLPRSIRLRDFRHFHATYLIAAGVDPRTVSDRLGHASPSFTLTTYAHAATAAQEQAAAVANELLTKTTRFTGQVSVQKH